MKSNSLISLNSYKNIPKKERWLFSNKKALKQLEQGLEDAKAGRVSKKGSFAKFVAGRKK